MKIVVDLRMRVEPSANESLLGNDGLKCNSSHVGYDREKDDGHRHTLGFEQENCPQS